MRPEKLTLCAWGPYRDKQEIDFRAFNEKGIFLITGATGAGKTTIFDAITYALYGSLSGDERDKERGSVRSDFADVQTPTYVELEMEHGGKKYRILRNPEYMRPKKRGASFTREKENAILYYPDGRVLEGVREVNAALQELLVLDYQQFKKISMIAQGEFAKLLVAPPKEKTRIFREIFGTGIYEKFTAGLGQRSRQLYAKVMEKKHKLEEDIRLLTVGLEKSVWNDVTRDELLALTGTENWNYEALGELLSGMEKEACECAAEWKGLYEKADKSIERLTGKLSKEEELLRKQEQLAGVLEEKEQLQARSKEYKEKEKKLTLSVNAGFVEGAEQLVVQLGKQIETTEAAVAKTEAEYKLLSEEAADLNELTKNADRLRELLTGAAQMKELGEALEQAEKQISEKEKQLKAGQERYLVQEADYRKIKAAYEEESHRRQLSAIGLAAALLQEGCPCPVCGSLTHPKPAKPAEGVISEEELESLKGKMEQAEIQLRSLHENTVTVKTILDGSRQSKEQTEEKYQEIQKFLLMQEDALSREYLAMSPESALNRLDNKCRRAGAVAELILEKQRQKQQLCEQQKELKGQLSAAEKNFAEALEQYGFKKAAEYQSARIERKEREVLQKDLDLYKKAVAANKELYQHLKDTVKTGKKVDIQGIKEEIAETKLQKESALKQQKNWEHARAEVKKTRGLMKDKLQEIGEASEEYGYVKDLENMATGNNTRRLVFEQYVLAGYFEEILKAANLRFMKMTSGRYEMSRVGEVGDGRVKDNLEIQVLDYYTGKYRSVRTLSGGESFKASLALALGMSDVIQSMNGGIRVDTLFVDEGFGALDEESLDQACNTLMNLVEKNCLIGIISHVGELRERIEKQLVIEKTNSGSRVRTV